MAFLSSDLKVSAGNTPKRSRHESARGLIRSPATKEFKDLGTLYSDKPMWNTPRAN